MTFFILNGPTPKKTHPELLLPCQPLQISRVLALSLLGAILPTWMGVVCAIHWGFMFIWLAIGQHQTAACSSRCEELLLSIALGLAYVLAFISPRDGPTRYVYLAYYLICFMENTGALVVW
ncbi:hypothetical protein GWI33_009409 [Rhynchophorus ferrugineus]|uniref:XK-related protein n=1 Tax=Rhynchophorus ferrugineus TaxID=354439 RepID=A0A834MG58_RHYFE|nr:hypothetical protein GWI33_009409 [Rhynchophorus ferrugineus]